MISFCLIVKILLFKIVMAEVPFHISNKGDQELWIGIQGNDGHPHLKNGGFKLAPGQTETVPATDNWQGRIWARTGCDDQSMHCVTGDCGNKLECAGAGGVPPATLCEITLKGDSGLDNYDISIVDGFNVPASIEPIDGESDGSDKSCKTGSCPGDINQSCPEELQVKDGDQVVACQSACEHFNTDEYCCRGAHDTEPTCRSSDWPKDYSGMFKKVCPDSYTYAYDDHTGLITCKASGYNMNFGGT